MQEHPFPSESSLSLQAFHTGQGTSSHFSSEAFPPRERDVSRANTCQVSAGSSGVTGTLPRGCLCFTRCFTLLPPGIYCFHFPRRWKLSLIMDILTCINNICNTASWGSGVREMRSSVPGWGAIPTTQRCLLLKHCQRWMPAQVGLQLSRS